MYAIRSYYAKCQYLLRQATDINTSGTAGSKIGKIQAALMSFVGDTLVTSNSVYIDNIQATDSNRIEFYDDSGTKRTNPYVAAGTMYFNAPLVGAGSSYRLMFAAPPGAGDDYGEAGAVTVVITSYSIHYTKLYDQPRPDRYSCRFRWKTELV